MIPSTEFDAFTDNYEQELGRGISVSGESKDYFSEQRVRWLCGSLRKLNQSPNSVFDFGCGVGASSVQLLELLDANRYVGVDTSANSIERARKEFGSPNRRFDVLRDSSDGYGEEFDLAYCNGVFHHIPLEDRLSAARYVYNSLRPGGIFSFWENNPWNPGTRYVMSRIAFDRDARTLSVREASRLLRTVGFSIVSRDFLFIFPRMMKRLRFLEPPLSMFPLGAQYQILCQRSS